jgi:hypothetical protein
MKNVEFLNTIKSTENEAVIVINKNDFLKINERGWRDA